MELAGFEPASKELQPSVLVDVYFLPVARGSNADLFSSLVCSGSFYFAVAVIAVFPSYSFIYDP